MSHVTAALGGQVTSLHAGFLMGHISSPALHSHLVLSHIRILTALLSEVPELESFDFDLLVGASKDREGKSWYALMKNADRLRSEIGFMEEVVGELEHAIAEVMAELHALRNIAAQLSLLQGNLQQSSDVIAEARDALEREVIPEVEHLLETLRGLLDIYNRELKLRQLHLWRLETVFRFRVPYMRDIRAKRLRRAAEREKREQEERGEGQGEGAEAGAEVGAEGAEVGAEGAEAAGAALEGAEAEAEGAEPA